MEAAEQAETILTCYHKVDMLNILASLTVSITTSTTGVHGCQRVIVASFRAPNQ